MPNAGRTEALWGVRAVAVAAMLFIVLAGAPDIRGESLCEEDVWKCVDSAAECVAHNNEPCFAFQQPQCPGSYKCQPGVYHGCHPENPYAVVCVPDSPD